MNRGSSLESLRRGPFAETIVRSTPLSVAKNGPKRRLARAPRVSQTAQPNTRQSPSPTCWWQPPGAQARFSGGRSPIVGANGSRRSADCEQSVNPAAHGRRSRSLFRSVRPFRIPLLVKFSRFRNCVSFSLFVRRSPSSSAPRCTRSSASRARGSSKSDSCRAARPAARHPRRRDSSRHAPGSAC